MVSRHYSIGVDTFPSAANTKAQALKPLEEAAEVFGAWQQGDRFAVMDEVADTIQACCNVLAALDVTQAELNIAMIRCRMRNTSRGRYEDAGE